MREIKDHIVRGDAAGQLRIEVLDEPGFGGACHEYRIATDCIGAHGRGLSDLRISFQDGPIPENGVNGVTNEALLAVVVDRLRCFQEGPFACEENHNALVAALASLECLKIRTQRRIDRGVEGKLER